MTEVPDQESCEGKRARILKASLMSLLEEVVDLMEDARKEGFMVEFSIGRDPEGRNVVIPENVHLIKRW